MSAILGPIHTWLYNKIMFQYELTNHIINYSLQSGYREELNLQLNDKFGTLEEDIASIIDESNIHGWLQDKIEVVEKRLALVVKSITDYDSEKIMDINDAVYEFGQKHASKKGLSLKEVYEYLDNILLNGMPCDNVNKILNEDENRIRWIQTVNIHELYWSMIKGGVNYYNEIRESLISGMLEKCGVEYNQMGKQTFELKKEESMYGIDLLMKEHENILKFTKFMKSICCNIIDGSEVDTKLLRECVDFGRNYADKHHHGKEEKVLFRYMLDKLGDVAEKLVRNGMLVEHDLGRYHMGELEKALDYYDKTGATADKLDIITNAAGYANLLKRHIEKEDGVCYEYAQRMLNNEDKKLIDEETVRFENEAKKNGVQDKYLLWLRSKCS